MGGYGQRYAATDVRGYADQFFAGVEESELSRVVRHCDAAAEGLVGEEPTLILEDDMAPLGPDADQAQRGEDLGGMPDF